jgi:hypothetical protein
VREGVAQVLDDWVNVRAREKGLTRFIRRNDYSQQLEFVDGFIELEYEHIRQLELERRVLEEARALKEELLGAIEAAAAATDDPADRLFAEDTARGLKLIQMLSHTYDVVVMNPPYGAFVPKVKDFVKTAYPLTYNDIYAAFIDRTTMLIEPEGYVGALVSRTFMTHKTHERLRMEILLRRNPLMLLLDLGKGILEAAVQTVALALRGEGWKDSETTREQDERAYDVVTEAEQRAAFFELERFRGGKGEPDTRHEMFVKALRGEIADVRFDVARRDFGTIEGSPLAYRRVGLVAHIFRDVPSLEPGWGIARQGKATADDSRWLRQWWEVADRHGWVPFAKGGDFCRFYYDIDLVLDWREEYREALKASGNALPSLEHYFKPGLTWPLRTQRGFNLRVIPSGCIFGHKGPAVFPSREGDTCFILGVANSAAAEYLLQGLMSFGSWEVGVIKRLPIPQPTSNQHERIASLANTIDIIGFKHH